MVVLARRSIVHLLHRASQIAEAQFATSFGTDELTARQLILLSAVAERQGCNQALICEMTGIDRSTLADLVRRLVTRGHITRRRQRRDSRAYALRLTENGASVLERALVALHSAEAELLSELTAKQSSDLADILAKLSGESATAPGSIRLE